MADPEINRTAETPGTRKSLISILKVPLHMSSGILSNHPATYSHPQLRSSESTLPDIHGFLMY
jgi:hypothetical protein